MKPNAPSSPSFDTTSHAVTIHILLTNDLVMTKMYSFLEVAERLTLGQVDRTFYQDDRRGTVEGVYSKRGLSIHQALEQISSYLFAQFRPTMILQYNQNVRYLLLDLSPRGNSSPFLQRRQVFQEEVEPQRQLEEWFDQDKNLYNLEKIEHLESQEIAFANAQSTLLSMFQTINEKSQSTTNALHKIRRDLELLPVPPPYNALFTLMNQHGIDTTIYESGYFTPTVLWVFRDANTGETVKHSIQKCDDCQQVRSRVQAEACGAAKPCFLMASRCRSCTRYRTCDSCGRRACSCRYVSCSHAECDKFLCACTNIVDAHTLEEMGPCPGCAFAVVSETAGPAGVLERYYCGQHKPVCAVPYQGVIHHGVAEQHAAAAPRRRPYNPRH